MEQKSMSEITKKLQPLLRKFEGDDGLVIEEATEEAGSKLGDNYTSVMIRTKLAGKYGNGSPYKRNIMTKIIPRERVATQFMNTEDLHNREGYIYEQVLPVLGDFGPRCIAFDKDEICMQDLLEQGYTLTERQKLLDLKQCRATLQKLAEWHAKSLSVKLNDPETFERLASPLTEMIFPDHSGQSIGKTIDKCIPIAIDHLEFVKPRTKEVENAIEYLRSIENHCFHMIRNLLRGPKDKYHAIGHGDLWMNNILYRRDEDGKVLDLKFVDYQIVRHTSIALDIHYFLYTSAQTSALENHYDELLDLYYDTFLKKLEEFDVSAEHRENMSKEWFKSELQKFSIYGLITGFWLVHALLDDQGVVVDMDKITLEDLEKMDFWKPTITTKKVDRVKCIATHYIRTYLQ